MAPTMLRVMVFMFAAAAALPSCEDDTAAHCLCEDESCDMSPEGIDACLNGLADRSQSCTDFLALLAGCKADISGDGVCAAAHGNGETMPCLLQRTQPEALSEECRAALPKNTKKGLALYWADGKRQLHINEISELNKDDKETYNSWMSKKKKKGKSDKDKEREYAVKAAKRERVIELIKAAVSEAVSAEEKPSVKVAIEAASAEAKKALAEDMTGTLKPFGKEELENLARDAYKVAIKGKKEEL